MNSSPSPNHTPPSRRTTVAALGVVLASLLFYVLYAGSSIRTLSVTADEPLHVVGAWNVRFNADYRPNREDPPLWLHYISLFLDRTDVNLEYTPEMWAASGGGANPQDAYFDALKSSPTAVNYNALVPKARWAMLWVAALFCAVLAAAAWHAGGPLAGAAAAVLFALEPLFLGHGPLVKNDVAFSMCFFATCYTLYRFCLTGRWRWLAAAVLSTAAAVTVKYSGLLLLTAVIPAMLALRALTTETWNLGKLSPLTTRLGRAGAAIAVYLLIASTSYLTLWACYGFRFAASPGQDRFDVAALINRTAAIDLTARHAKLFPTREPDPRWIAAQAPTWQPPLFVRTVLTAYERKLLPEAMCAGLIFTYASTLYRPSFLLGQYSDLGWWYYFPVAYAAKTPVTTLAALLTAALLAVTRRRELNRLSLLLLTAGPAIYLLSAMAGKLNIGLRHLSPLYPFLILAIALTAAWAYRTLPRRASIATFTLTATLLAAEVLPHRLQYIQFFNLPAGGTRGGLALLSDSNLDWGQDLYRLLAWQKAHPTENLHLNYFGVLDPRRQGLTYQNLNGSWAPGPATTPQPGDILAISATHLQGTYFYTTLRQQMAQQRTETPIEVLGGTIYLYRVPPK